MFYFGVIAVVMNGSLEGGFYLRLPNQAVRETRDSSRSRRATPQLLLPSVLHRQLDLPQPQPQPQPPPTLTI